MKELKFFLATPYMPVAYKRKALKEPVNTNTELLKY